MAQNLFIVFFFIWLFCAILFVALVAAYLSNLKEKWLERLSNKRDLKFFEKVLFGLLSSKQPKSQKGNPILNIDRMTGHQFEIFLKELFKSLGYRVKKTPDSGDFGADLYMEKDGKTYIVQAKRYKSKVGIKAVQEIVAAKSYYKAEYAIVVTNNYFTEAAKELAKKNNVILCERPDLIKLVEKSKMIMGKIKQAKNIKSQNTIRKGGAL
jgi:restriction system protein